MANLTWWTMWSGSSLIPIEQMVKQFNSTHPTIHVTEVNVPELKRGRQAVERPSPPATHPTCSRSGTWSWGEDAQTGAILPMNQYLTGKYAGLEKWEYPLLRTGRPLQREALCHTDGNGLVGPVLQQEHHESGRHKVAADHVGAVGRRPGQGVED